MCLRKHRYMKGEIMPNRDGKGPRRRSPRPSRPKGGLKKGKCK